MVTRDNLRSLRNDFPVCHMPLGNECRRVASGYSNCWRLWQLLEAAVGCRQCPQYDGKCSSILIIFSHNSNKPRHQTESCLFSDLDQMITFYVILLAETPFGVFMHVCAVLFVLESVSGNGSKCCTNVYCC